MSPLEEIPSMIQLDAPELGEVVLIFGAESIVDGVATNRLSSPLMEPRMGEPTMYMRWVRRGNGRV